MIDELRHYSFTAQAWEHYWLLFNEQCLPIRGDDFGRLRGLWYERIGDTVNFRHVWRYDSLDERARLRAELGRIDAWREGFLPQAAAHVGQQFLQVLIPRIDDPQGGLSAAREQLCGLWSTEFPDPNQVVVMTSTEQAPVLDLTAAIAIETRRLQPLGLSVSDIQA